MGQSSLLRLQEGRRPTVRRPFAAAAVRYRTYATAAFDRTARDLHDGASPQLERLPDDQPHQTRSRELAASRLQAVVRILRGVMMDEYYEAQPEGWQAAVPRLQAVVRSKLVRNNYYPFVPDDRSPPSTRTSSFQSYTPSPSSSTASAATTASPGSPASPTLLPSPCAIFPSPPSPLPFDAASAATVLSTRARAALHQHCLRASQAAAATLTTRIRASLARIRDNYRRAALPGPRASVVNTNLTAAPSGSSASCSPTTSAAFPRAQPLKSSSPPADQAAATTLSAFARAAPARTGYISQTAALPSCPRADNQASNFKFTAAPKDATASRLETTYAGPPRAAPPGTSCKPSLRPASKPFSPGILPTPLPQPRPGILPDPPLSPSRRQDDARARSEPRGPPLLPPPPRRLHPRPLRHLPTCVASSFGLVRGEWSP